MFRCQDKFKKYLWLPLKVLNQFCSKVRKLCILATINARNCIFYLKNQPRFGPVFPKVFVLVFEKRGSIRVKNLKIGVQGADYDV